MKKARELVVALGGECRELWTDRGLQVSYQGQVRLLAERGADGWEAALPSPERLGDVKDDMAVYERARELACRINDGSAPPLTLAYFRAAASALANLPEPGRRPPQPPEGALPLLLAVDGLYDSLILPETLRLLLDEHSLPWEDAVEAVAAAHAYAPEAARLPERRDYKATAPLAAVAAIQPRAAGLIRAVNEKLCERLWAAWPGDWKRIGEASILRDGEVCFPALAAYMCGHICCSPALAAGALRTMYTLFPDKFKLTEENI